MKKRIIAALLLCVLFIHNMSFWGQDNESVIQCNFKEWDDGRTYLCYEFGFSKIVTVYIAEGDSVCDVFICNNSDMGLLTECSKVPILKWAFESLDDVSGNSRKESNEYTPFFYQLSIIKDGHRKVAASSSFLMSNDEELESKIEELKNFIMRLWGRSLDLGANTDISGF